MLLKDCADWRMEKLLQGDKEAVGDIAVVLIRL